MCGGRKIGVGVAGDAAVEPSVSITRILPFIAVVAWPVAGQNLTSPPNELPAAATSALVASLQAAAAHAKHIWRDTAPTNSDGTVNAYIEIARGDRRKWEFDMGANARAIDRMIPADIGGYPVNYGFVPQTVSYDGDPFDALVLGPPLADGRLVRGVIVGVMFMEDEKGLDSKVVLSRTDANGRAVDALTPQRQREIGDYFNRYKQHQPGAFSKVPGWGAPADGLAYVTMTHAFYRQCQRQPRTACRIRE
jgi:inorganic pyrophosphatase